MPVLQEINPCVRSIKPLQFLPLEIRAAQIREELKQGVKKPFRELIDLTWGDPQRIGLKPLTFVRQLLAACLYPQLRKNDRLPADVKQKADGLLSQCWGGSLGSYTDLPGIPLVAAQISEFIAKRDGVTPPNIENIFISPGSQWALQNILSLLIHGHGGIKTGVLTPRPCHVTSIMSVASLGGVPVPYYLSEEHSWELQIEELNRVLESAKQKYNLVALYVINPGNPSGHVQRRKSIQDVIRFAFEKRLFLLADEVYQDCVYPDDIEFLSYRRVLAEMGPPYSDTVELASFHSVSKGIMGECGLRCGYVELVNMDKAVLKHTEIIFSKDNAPTAGQIALSAMVNLPEPGDPAYPLFEMETQKIRSSIKANARQVHEVMNSLPGVTCQTVEGGAFAFPRIFLPAKAIQKAQELDMEPDAFYCLRLLEETGAMITPGCEYGQKKGSHHIRFCIMAPSDIIDNFLKLFVPFHTQLMKEFS